MSLFTRMGREKQGLVHSSFRGHQVGVLAELESPAEAFEVGGVKGAGLMLVLCLLLYQSPCELALACSLTLGRGAGCAPCTVQVLGGGREDTQLRAGSSDILLPQAVAPCYLSVGAWLATSGRVLAFFPTVLH